MAFDFKTIKVYCSNAAPRCLVGAFFFFPISMALGYIAMLATGLLWLLGGKVRAHWSIVKRQPVVWAGLGLYGLVFLGILYAKADADYVALHISKYGKFLLLPVFIALLSDARWRYRCMTAFAAAMLFVLFSVYASIWFDLPWSKTHNQGWGVDHTVVGDYITQSIMMTFLVVVALDRGMHAVSHWAKGAWWSAAVLAVLSITHLSSGRTGYVLLVAALLVFFMVATQGARRWVALCVLAIGVTVVVSTSPTIQQRVQLAITEVQTSDRMEITSIGGRVNFWKNTWQLVEERPLMGWGTGSYHAQWCQVVATPQWCAFGRWHPHNQFLFFWVEHGIPGLVLFAVLVFAPAWAARRAHPAQQRLLLSFFTIFFIDSMINSPLWSSRESHFFIFMSAWLAAEAMFSPRRHSGGLPGNALAKPVPTCDGAPPRPPSA